MKPRAVAAACALLAGCGGGTTLFGYPLNQEARIENRADRDLGCASGKYGGATIQAHVESSDGDSYEVCCNKGKERCASYFCTHSADGTSETCKRQ